MRNDLAVLWTCVSRRAHAHHAWSTECLAHASCAGAPHGTSDRGEVLIPLQPHVDRYTDEQAQEALQGSVSARANDRDERECERQDADTGGHPQPVRAARGLARM